MRKDFMKALKHYLTDQRGNLNMAMGTDLFATLLLVFIISTAILLKAPKEGANAKSEEMKTPEISLSKSTSGGLPMGAEKSAVSVSAKRNLDGSIEYYVGDEKTTISGISGLLRAQNPGKVELRLDENLTNGVTVSILGQLQDANVKEINYIFIKKGGNND